MEKIKSRDTHKGLLAAALMLLGAFAYADAPAAPVVTPQQTAFEMFYGSTTDRNGVSPSSPSFYSFFTAPDRPELAAFANHLADSLEPAGAARDYLRGRLLARFQRSAGPNRTNDANAAEQYVLAAILYGLGRPAGVTTPPLNLLPARSDAERNEFLASLRTYYDHYLNQPSYLASHRTTYAAPLSDTDFLTNLTREILSVSHRDPATQGYIVVMGQRDGHPSPLSLLAPWAAGRPVAPANAGRPNPFAPVRPVPPPPPVAVLTNSPDGTPVLNFARMAETSSGYTWRTDTSGGRSQRVLYQTQAGGSPVEVGRVWSQGGFTYLNYTGPNRNSQEYGFLYPLGAGGALPAGQIQALPSGIDYSRIQSQAVRDVMGGTRQVVLLPTGNGRYQDLAGNPYQTTARQEQVYYACGRFGRRTCVGYQSSEEIRPVDTGSAPHASLSMPAAGAPAAAHQFQVVTQPQPNEWGATRIVRRNGHSVGYVITVGGQDVMFVGSPTSHRWAIYRMDGQPVTLNFTGQPIVARRTSGGATVHLIPTGGNNYVDVAGLPYEVNGSIARRTGL